MDHVKGLVVAKKITGGSNTEARPWREGMTLAGFFLSADVLPKCDSRKLTFRTLAGELLAVWETAALARQVEHMTIGNFYHVGCLGKTLETKNGKAWEFEVLEAENEAEQKDMDNNYRTLVANGTNK